MKPATFFHALILLSTKHLLFSEATVDDTLVYDREGNQLQKHASYFISPPIRGPLGDSVTLATPIGENQTCTEADVVQVFLNYAPSTPFTFTPVALNEDVVKLRYPLAIQSTESPCDGSTVWKVSSRTGVVSGNIITTGGVINTPSSCLRITKPQEPKFQNSYMFEYCPNLCGAAPKICLPIGNSMGHLSPNGEPFEFVLDKASESAAIV
uniref:miraculin-like n=1 Tax=Erigeron canadensis TaxID=72917 RepID=UPI001CB99024|nr:miraculin-like [Erigeron canadensis]